MADSKRRKGNTEGRLRRSLRNRKEDPRKKKVPIMAEICEAQVPLREPQCNRMATLHVCA